MSVTAAVFLILFVTGCYLAFARHPIYGLITYLGVYYLHPPSRWWGVVLPQWRWSLLASFITLAALLLQRDKKPETIPLFRQGAMVGLVLFLAWIAIESLWALDWNSEVELLTLAPKYVLLAALIYKCIRTEQHLRMFLWAHVLGCAYLGWLVYTTYQGGRFEEFGGADINEANSAALVIVTGVFVGASLFLIGKWWEKLLIFATMPFIVNALVATISRSAFLALGCGGVLYNLFSPRGFRLRVAALSALAIVMFLLLTNPVYWARISSLEEAGQDIEGVDTGIGRVALMKAQWQMFLVYPMGCGHRCTVVLSPRFLENKYLAGVGEHRSRASHNTVLTLLVEHGIPGLLLYVLFVFWIFKNVRSLVRSQKDREGFLPALVPAIAAVAGAMVVGDLFVDYLILECRVWFMGIIMVMVNMSASAARPAGGVDALAARPNLRLPKMTG